MRRLAAFLLLSLVLVLGVGALSVACGSADQAVGDDLDMPDVGGSSGLQSTLDDWIVGTDFGVESGTVDQTAKTVTLRFSEDRYSDLSDQDRSDIAEAVGQLTRAGAGGTEWSSGSILIEVDGEVVEELAMSGSSGGGDVGSSGASGSATTNLVFIHHSVGENWLNDGLCQALNDRGYHVADIYYGWREYGDYTDTVDWPTWFTDEVMDLVYQEMGNMTAPNTLAPASGENTIVMFKSCFPNSDVGDDISDEQAVYMSLLSYFEEHPNKMFVLVTPPPMQSISDPQATRQLCDWLTDRQTGWLAGLSTGNVFVFDLYNVLTDPDAHHELVDGKEVHVVVPGHDTLHYDSDGDDHPNSAGNVKATGEFVGLLDLWYQQFVDSQG